MCMCRFDGSCGNRPIRLLSALLDRRNQRCNHFIIQSHRRIFETFIIDSQVKNVVYTSQKGESRSIEKATEHVRRLGRLAEILP